MKKQLFLGLVATAVVSGASAVEITKEWKIVVPRHEAGVVRFGYEKASQALQKDLAEGAGLKLEIVRTPPNDGPAIHLGADAAKAAGVRTEFVGTDPAKCL